MEECGVFSVVLSVFFFVLVLYLFQPLLLIPVLGLVRMVGVSAAIVSGSYDLNWSLCALC